MYKVLIKSSDDNIVFEFLCETRQEAFNIAYEQLDLRGMLSANCLAEIWRNGVCIDRIC